MLDSLLSKSESILIIASRYVTITYRDVATTYIHCLYALLIEYTL